MLKCILTKIIKLSFQAEITSSVYIHHKLMLDEPLLYYFLWNEVFEPLLWSWLGGCLIAGFSSSILFQNILKVTLFTGLLLLIVLKQWWKTICKYVKCLLMMSQWWLKLLSLAIRECIGFKLSIKYSINN